MKTLVFDIWADIGHFRKYYTTSSPLTFSFPPPPTIAGMLGAIIGSSKNQYLHDFSLEQMYLGVALLKPVKKFRWGINYINTKDNFWQPVYKKNHEARTQIRVEFLSNPAFRIYVHHKNPDIFQRLIDSIKRHYTYFTLSMGLSELIADFRWVGLYESRFQNIEKEDTINSVIPERYLTGQNLALESDRRYGKEQVPVQMTPDRVVEKYENVFFETDGKTLKLKPGVPEKIICLENGEKYCYF
jgi:CRISPR-associated protein Cas5h